ncbi:MAG: hypothetical protein ACLSDO_03745 [Anaerotruncus colihominis]
MEERLSDRAVAIYQGRLNGKFSKEITQDNLTSASFGLSGKEANV